MKKITTILMLAFAAGVANEAMAQEVVTLGSRVYEAKKFRFGAYVAPTISSMKPTAAKDKDNQQNTLKGDGGVGFTYGLMAEYWFAENYGLVSGLQMNMAKGGIKTTSVDPGANDIVRKSDINYKLNFLEIPLALKMRTDPIENFTFFGQVGFSLGINVGKKVDYDITYADALGVTKTITGTNERLSSRGIAPTITPAMLSMNLGLGAEYPINNKLAGYFGFFYNNGFLPDATYPTNYSLDNGNMPKFSDGNVRVNNFAFRLGLFF